MTDRILALPSSTKGRVSAGRGHRESCVDDINGLIIEEAEAENLCDLPGSWARQLAHQSHVPLKA